MTVRIGDYFLCSVFPGTEYADYAHLSIPGPVTAFWISNDTGILLQCIHVKNVVNVSIPGKQITSWYADKVRFLILREKRPNFDLEDVPS